MKRISKKLVCLAIILLLLVWLAPFFVQAETVRITPKNPVNLEVGIGGFKQVTGGIAQYIGQIYWFATAIVGGLAVVMIIIGAVQYSSSAGNKAAIGSAKETMTSAIIGLVIVLMAYLILGSISGDFVNLANPRLNTIKITDSDPSVDDQNKCGSMGGQFFSGSKNVTEVCQAKCPNGSNTSKDFSGDSGVCCFCLSAGSSCPSGYYDKQHAALPQPPSAADLEKFCADRNEGKPVEVTEFCFKCDQSDSNSKARCSEVPPGDSFQFQSINAICAQNGCEVCCSQKNPDGAGPQPHDCSQWRCSAIGTRAADLKCP